MGFHNVSFKMYIKEKRKFIFFKGNFVSRSNEKMRSKFRNELQNELLGGEDGCLSVWLYLRVCC